MTYNISESALRDKCSKYLKTVPDLWFFKVYGNGVQKGGVADFIICYKGKFIAIELKKPKDSYGITDRQRIELKKIKFAGGIAYAINSLDDLKLILDNIK